MQRKGPVWQKPLFEPPLGFLPVERALLSLVWMSSLTEQLLAALFVLWGPSSDHRSGFVSDADIHLKSPCYRWWLPRRVAAVLPAPARAGPSQQLGCPSERCHLPGGHHLLSILQVAFPCCCSSMAVWRKKMLVKRELRRSESQSLGANCWSVFAVPSCHLLHCQPQPPLTLAVHGKFST